MILETIKKYKPTCQQEEMDKKLIIEFIKQNPDALYRTNLAAHITSSAIVVNENLDKVVFAYHLIYKEWAWLGGHNDGDGNCLRVAIRETKEETGLVNIKPFYDEPVMLDAIFVENHIKNGKYVPDHLHLNLTYLLVADEKDELIIKEDENSGVKWFDIEDIFNISDEKRMKPIYGKVVELIKKIREKRL